MDYTLNQSVKKFLLLRQRLRELIGPPKSPIELPPQVQKQNCKAKKGKKELFENSQKENNQCNGSLQETQRKLIKTQTQKLKPNEITSFDGKQLIKSKEQTLQDINQLLMRKQQILGEIQKQIVHQCRVQQGASWQPFDEEKTVIKAPNLQILREQRKKMKKTSLI